MASGDEFVGLGEDFVGEDRDGRGAVAGDFIEFGCGFFDEVGADFVAEGFVVFYLEVDVFSDGYAVVSDGRAAEGFFDYDIATFGAECDFYCVVEGFCAAENACSGVVIVEYFFWHDLCCSASCARRSSSFHNKLLS